MKLNRKQTLILDFSKGGLINVNIKNPSAAFAAYREHLRYGTEGDSLKLEIKV